jgi:hypothetical protein
MENNTWKDSQDKINIEQKEFLIWYTKIVDQWKFHHLGLKIFHGYLKWL